MVALKASVLRHPEDGPGGQTADPFAAARLSMVADQIAARGISDARVLEAMRTVPRHEFVREADHATAYIDAPLGINHGQTISQPFIVALMTALARPTARIRPKFKRPKTTTRATPA